MPGNTTTHRREDRARLVIESPDSFATTLLMLFLDRNGTEALNWSPETVAMEMYDDFGVVVPHTNFDRLMVGVSLLISDGFYKSLPDFAEFCCVLSGEGASPHLLQLPTVCDIAWGLTEGLLLVPPTEDEPFTEEIIGFVAEMVKQEGIINPPDVLRLGHIDRGLKNQINQDYSDDPDMMSMIWKVEDSKKSDINDVIKARLEELFRQLATLPLINGDASSIIEKMQRNLKDSFR